MALPLRKIVYATALLIILILGGLLVLGVQQYRLHKHHQEIIAYSERLLFQFAGIRETVMESLLSGELERLPLMAPEVESLHAEIAKVVESALIPNEYKLAFINQVDLPTITRLLRNAGAERLQPAGLRQLGLEVRSVDERLMFLNRVLANYAKQRVIGFQNVIIGALALVISLLVTILVLGHRQVTTPLLFLAREVKEVAQGKRRDLSGGLQQHPGELAELSLAFHNLFASQAQSLEQMDRQNRILYSVHQAGRAVRKAVSREDLFKEVSRALLFNEDYCLVWIGEPDQEGRDLEPMLAESSSFLKESRREECLALLLTEASEREGKIDTAVQALREGKPLVESDILAGIPKGHLQDTPLAEGIVNRICLPLIWENRTYGVVSIYSGQKQSFAGEEMKLLGKMATDVAFALYYLEARQELIGKRQLTGRLLEMAEIMAVRLGPDGHILEANSAAARVLGASGQDLVGRRLIDFLPQPEEAGRETPLPLDRIAESTLLAGEGRKLPCRWCLLPEQPGQEMLWLGVILPPPGREGYSEAHPSPREALAERAIGMAHEINNTSNGIINYAQLLTDTLESTEIGEQQNLLERIIKEGERIATIVQPLLYGEREKGERRPEGGTPAREAS